MGRRNLTILAVSIAAILICLPPRLRFKNVSFSAIIQDENGDLLSAQIANDEQWRLPFINEVPSKFESCILTYEDKRFYVHPGIDPIALLRAVRLNLKHRRTVSGGSTIPMQLARLSFDNPPRNILSKIREAIYAIKLSIWHSKKEVLGWYVSLAPFGGNVVGLRAASWRYYGKQPDELTWAQSATLAVLPNAPGLIHVNRNRSDLLNKRNALLKRLMENGTISMIDLEAALLEPLPEKLNVLPSHAPHFLEFCKKKNYNAELQCELQKQINTSIKQLGLEWFENGIYNAGVVVLSIETGQALAYVGNIPGTGEEAQVDMVQALRSSGSILKPFLYAAMVDEGLMSPFVLQRDVPIYIGGFSPSNYNKDFAGLIPADVALQRSLNVPAVLMLQEYGVDKFLRKLRLFGFSSLSKSAEHYGLSLILGGGEVSLWQLAHAYRNIVLCLQGQKNWISPGAAYHTLKALTELRRPDEAGNWQRFESSIPISWKTGTSYGHRDAWAVGVTSEVVIAIWVGNADGEGRNGLTGSTSAGRLLFRILEQGNFRSNGFDIPFENMSQRALCQHSGMLAGPNCPATITKELADRTGRTPTCTYHKLFYIDPETKMELSARCRDDIQGLWQSFFVMDPVAAKYYRIAHPEFTGMPKVYPDCAEISLSDSSIEYMYPNPEEKIYLPIDLNGRKQEVVFEIAHRDPEAELFWYLDEQYLGRTKERHTMTLNPEIGAHKVTVWDISGASKARNFEVIPN